MTTDLICVVDEAFGYEPPRRLSGQAMVGARGIPQRKMTYWNVKGQGGTGGLLFWFQSQIRTHFQILRFTTLGFGGHSFMFGEPLMNLGLFLDSGARIGISGQV